MRNNGCGSGSVSPAAKFPALHGQRSANAGRGTFSGWPRVLVTISDRNPVRERWFSGPKRAVKKWCCCFFFFDHSSTTCFCGRRRFPVPGGDGSEKCGQVMRIATQGSDPRPASNGLECSGINGLIETGNL